MLDGLKRNSAKQIKIVWAYLREGRVMILWFYDTGFEEDQRGGCCFIFCPWYAWCFTFVENRIKSHIKFKNELNWKRKAFQNVSNFLFMHKHPLLLSFNLSWNIFLYFIHELMLWICLSLNNTLFWMNRATGTHGIEFVFTFWLYIGMISDTAGRDESQETGI